MTSKQNMRVMHNSVGSWKTELYYYARHTITSFIPKQLFNALVIGSPEFAKSSNRVILSMSEGTNTVVATLPLVISSAPWYQQTFH